MVPLLAVQWLAGFNSQPPEGGCSPANAGAKSGAEFQLTAARRRLQRPLPMTYPHFGFQLTAARRRLLMSVFSYGSDFAVSTHSRPKAAASLRVMGRFSKKKFQLTDARMRLHVIACHGLSLLFVSPHSRPKAAAPGKKLPGHFLRVSTHSRPKAAAINVIAHSCSSKSFNSQPPEGGCDRHPHRHHYQGVSTHSRPKAAAVDVKAPVPGLGVSTHSRRKAAARDATVFAVLGCVSTHSRPKAAAIFH